MKRSYENSKEKVANNMMMDERTRKLIMSVIPNYGSFNIKAVSQFNLNICSEVWSKVKASCLFLVAYSKTVSKSSSWITPDLSDYICSMADWTLANFKIANISNLQGKTGGESSTKKLKKSMDGKTYKVL
jgi:hypothetical protein